MASVASGAKARVLVATGSQLIREGVAATARGRSGMDVGVAADAGELDAYCAREGMPDVLVMDPGLADAVRARVREHGLNCRILLLWSRPHSGEESLPREPWVCGLLKICSATPQFDVLLDAITRCRFMAAGAEASCLDCSVRQTTRQPPLPLSRREFDVFRRLGRGEGVKRIAEDLALSVKTVESHRENIKSKLDLDDAAALFEAALLWRRGEYSGPVRGRPGCRGNDALPAVTGCCLQSAETFRTLRAGRA